MRPIRRGVGLVVVMGAIAAPGAAMADASFQGLGFLAGGSPFSHANGISDDGQVVVGAATGPSGPEAFRWVGGVMTGLGDLPLGTFDSHATATNRDGSVVVGQGRSFSGDEAFRWEGGTMTPLGDLLGAPFESEATDVSGDGSIVAGWGMVASGIRHAFRWENGTLVDLGTLGGSVSRANAISADGRRIFGSSDGEAFEWTSLAGLVGLAQLVAGPDGAEGVSPDGDFPVGFAAVGGGGAEPTIWRSGAPESLGLLDPLIPIAQANAASWRGRVVVGFATEASGFAAFVWDAQHGLRSLKAVLEGLGLDLTGWTLSEANDVSLDGTRIVGVGTNPDGNSEAWLAEIPGPPIPALPPAFLPFGLVLLLGAGCGIVAARTRR